MASEAPGRRRPAPRLAIRTRRVEGAAVVAVRVWLRGGSRAEPTPGLSLVTGRMLSEGTRRRDWRRIAEEAEARGAALYSFGGLEMHGLGVDALAGDEALALEWAAELTLEPAFPADRCDWTARQARGELAAIADHPEEASGWSFLRQLYEPHPAARPLQGDAESLGRLRREDCAAFHRRSLEAGAIVTVAGRIDPEAARRRVEDLFASLAGEGRPHGGPRQPRGGPARQRHRLGDRDQAHLFLGRLTVERGDPLLPPLLFLAVVLGAGCGLGGRLPRRLREREGLAYACQVATAAGAGLDRGRLEIYAGIAPDAVERAIATVREELGRLAEEEITGAELEETRAYLLGREPFRRETARQWAEILAESELLGLPLDRPEWLIGRLQAVRRDDLAAAASRYLRPEGLRVTVGLPTVR